MDNPNTAVVVSVAQIDYARFVVRGEADYVMHAMNRLTHEFDTYRNSSRLLVGGCKAWGVPATKDQPAGRVWECWGNAAMFVYGLPFVGWARWLARLDVRCTVPDVDALGLDVMYSAFRAAGNARTVTRYISPARAKRHGAQTGGDSLAVGSHKSDVRLSWYIKPDAPLAYEVQCQHDVLRRLAWAVGKQVGDDTSSPELWHALSERISREGALRVKSLSGYEWLELLQMAADARADALLYNVGHDEPVAPDEDMV